MRLTSSFVGAYSGGLHTTGSLRLTGGVDVPGSPSNCSTTWLTMQTVVDEGARGLLLRRSGVGKPPQQILVVDDDVTLQEILGFFLGEACEVRSSATGADALLRVCHEPVDLVVLDYRLPDRTGLEILTDLRAIRPNLPVVMLTGYGSEWICAAAFKLGCADYFPKPVNVVDLAAAVRRILSPTPAESKWPREVPALSWSPAPLCMPVQKAIGLIQQRYWDHVSLSGLASQVGMSKFRLSHRFREALGMTFRDYLLRVRLERAKALLANGQASITEVAQMVGFGDLPRFDKLFKRYTGLTPSAYRSLALSEATGNKK